MIRQLILRNAGPFKGEHIIELRPMAYAITCRYEADPGRSNWGGKSFLLEMIRFAIDGKLPKHRRYDADGWITRGEREGAVGLVLEDGCAIKRERRRGQSTQVRFGSPERGKGAAQDEATAAMLKHLGFEGDDFVNIAYFEQKQMARLVLTEPEKRLDVVRGWLGLEKAERAEERAGEIANELMRELEKLRAKKEALVSTTPADPGVNEEALEKHIAKVKEVIAVNEAAGKRVEQLLAQRRQDEQTVREYDAIVEKGKALAEALAALDVTKLSQAETDARFAWEKVVAAHGEALTQLRTKKRVTLGQFDGKCPVADITCPARKQINDDRGAAQTAYEKAESEERRLRASKDAAMSAHIAAKAAFETWTMKNGQLELLRDDARDRVEEAKAARKRLKKAELVVDPSCPNQMLAARNDLADAEGKLADARSIRAQIERTTTELLKVEHAIDCLEHDVAIAIRSRAVFRATQRRVAERALEAINGRASVMLADAGIDLDVALRWEREGKGAAKQCEDCGAPFPASVKVKVCERCGAQRGQLVVQRLEFLPSDRSGAADDIAGVALQLAAGSWFLASRSSPWATAMLDEPLGACDRTNRRALSMQLVKLLGTGAWRQALVISHNPDTVELYPGRIEVVVARDGTRRIVQT